MLKNRIISKLLIDELGLAVKFKQFVAGHRIVGDPISTMRTMEDQRVDEFYICFLGAVDTGLVRQMTRPVFTPVCVAGGIEDMGTVDELITGCGVEKIVTKNPLVGACTAQKYGLQAVAWPFDYHGDGAFPEVPSWAGEVIATSIDRDGMMTGFDTGICRFPWRTPLVIAGGCGKLMHVADAFAAGASGVAISSMFAFTDKSSIKLRSWLVSNGSNVRVA